MPHVEPKQFFECFSCYGWLVRSDIRNKTISNYATMRHQDIALENRNEHEEEQKSILNDVISAALTI